jgi:hypothetical protein
LPFGQGDEGKKMEFGGWALFISLVGIIGLAGIGISWLLKFFGLTDSLQVIGSFFGTFVNAIGRVVSFAPRALQVILFLIFGVGMMGLVVNWVLASSVVCSEGNVYEGSFMSTTMAKFLDSSVSVDVNDPKTSEGVLEDTYELIFYDPLNDRGFSTWGSFVNYAGGLGLSDENTSQFAIMVALPLSVNESDERATIEDLVIMANETRFTAKAAVVDLVIIRDSWLSEKLHDGESGRCSLVSVSVGNALVFFGGASEIARFSYEVVQETQDLGDVFVGFVVKGFKYQGGKTLGDCPQASGDNELFLTTGPIGTALVESGRVESSGYVKSKYIQFENIVNMQDKILIEQQLASRSDFIRNAGEAFVALPIVEDQEGDLTYSCDEKDDVRVGIFGIQDALSVQSLLVFSGLVIFISFLGWLVRR